MSAPVSPSPSSSANSCQSDSETSNDSGIDSMAGGSLTSDYMDLDEFLVATGIKPEAAHSAFFSSTVPQEKKIRVECESASLSNFDKKHAAKENDNIEGKNEKLQTVSVKNVKKQSEKTENIKEENNYDYKYNPLPMKRKAQRQFVSDTEKDDKYWKRRTRNNEAARRSRDMRRQREIEISSQWQKLEEENARLKTELQKLKDKANELERQLMEKQN